MSLYIQYSTYIHAYYLLSYSEILPRSLVSTKLATKKKPISSLVYASKVVNRMDLRSEERPNKQRGKKEKAKKWA